MISFITHVCLYNILLFHFHPKEITGFFFVNKGTYCSDTDTILGKQTFMYYYAFWKKGPKISLKQVFEH